ncbi:MAG: MBL fold metallo-hydrolase [Erysipelotrichaceae bacterium]|nr:MBL fold metallo-hydrolase [Erysipelotrichaceae bacterium]
MKIDTLPIGLYQENSYVLHDHDHVLIIDPGRYPKQIAACISKKETVDGIILTHGHEDHTGAADDLSDLYECEVCMSMKDFFLVDPKNPLGRGFDAPVWHEITDLKGDMTIGTFKVNVIETPGHTIGSVCIRYRNLLFTGDTLFAGTIGRTDLESGNDAEMIASLKLLRELPHDLRILPGHGPASTIGNELKSNPYFVNLDRFKVLD